MPNSIEMTTRKTAQLLSLLLATTAAAPLAFAAPALAAETSAKTNADTSAKTNNAGIRSIEEITVSARRRDESLQDVPMSITAFTGASLQKNGFQDITAISQEVPNLTLKVSRGTNTTLTAFIRGVGQQDPVAGFESGVGFYIDDVYLNRPQGTVLDIFDVQRIEVLRGPQGTLYGRNTIGGAIKYVTKRLAAEPEFNLRVSAGNYRQLDVVASGSLPLNDKVRVGGAVARLTHDGYGKNINLPGIDNYDKDVIAARASVELLPSDSLSIRITGDYTDDKSDPRQGHRLIPGQLSGTPVLSDVYDTQAGLNNPKQSVKAKGISGVVEYQASDNIKLKNILAYRKDTSYSPIDFDSLPAVDLDVPVVYKNDQFSEEFQLLYQSDRLNGLVGLYYLDANASDAFDVILGTTGDLLNLPGLNAFTSGDVNTKTWAAFADFTYDLTDVVSLTLGGRYTSDKRTANILRQTMIGGTSQTFGGTATPIATTSSFDGSKTFKEFTPHVSIDWQVTPDHKLYASYSRGFKGGGFDPRGQTSATPDFNGDGTVSDAEIFQFMSFKPETVDSFEAGLKSSLAENRVNFSLSGFFSKYKDVQIPGSAGFDTNGDGINDSFTGITSNAASADIWGIEFEGKALLANDMATSGDDLSFNWTMGYLNAQYNKFIDAFGKNVADQRVFQNTPKWTLSGRLTYSVPMALVGNEGRLSFTNAVSYRSKTSQFETPNPFLDQPGYALWDASLVWQADSGNWELAVHGRNLTNKKYIVAGYNFVTETNGVITPTLGREGTLTAFYGNPRTVTATIGFHF